MLQKDILNQPLINLKKLKDYDIEKGAVLKKVLKDCLDTPKEIVLDHVIEWNEINNRLKANKYE